MTLLDQTVPLIHTLDGQDFNGNRLIVQFARGSKQRDPQFPQERPVPRTRRTIYRMTLTGLPLDTSWQACHKPTSCNVKISRLLTHIPGSQRFRASRRPGRCLLGGRS